jgi:hypothetical protein
MEEISATVRKNAENAQAANRQPPIPASSRNAVARWSRRRSVPWPRSRNPPPRFPTSSA